MRLRPYTFRSQLMLAMLGFVLLAEVLVAAAILQRTYEQRMAQARDSLQVAERVLDQLISLRADQLLSTVSILASDFGFKSAVATDDGSTQRSVLRNFGDRAHADMTLLASPQGALEILEPPTDLAGEGLPFDPVIERARRRGNAAGLVMVDGLPYQFIIAPVNAPRLIAWIGMGFQIDADVASGLASVTGVNVEFVARRDGETIFRTGPQSSEHGVGELDQGDAFLNNEKTLLEADDTRLLAVLSLSRATVLSPYYDLATSLVLVFIATLAVSALMAIGLARLLSQPVRDLSEFAESVAAGEYHDTPRAQGIGELDVLADALHNMQAAVRQREQRIRHQASHDALTGLRNRSSVRGLLAERMDAGQRLTLIRLALHEFSRVNAALGYKLGDDVLKAVAARLNAVCGDETITSRIEGNDFLVVADAPHHSATVAALTERLREAIERPVYLDQTEIQLRVEIGVVGVPEHAADIEAAWRRAVIARDASGRHQCATFVYEPGMDESHQRELSIIQELPPALIQSQLSLVYQPKMNLADGRVGQVEALSRWKHPRLGHIRPDEFVGLAERSGQIRLLTEWAVRQLCEDLRHWREQRMNIGVALNLSGDEIASPHLHRVLEPLFVAAGGEQTITLEVTESALLREPDIAIGNLRTLQARGARISVDDFGTGYSSLSQLKKLAPDELKIDKSFILHLAETPADQFIVNLIIDLGHKLGMQVVAEGVENERAWQHLYDRGANIMQGYYLARPMPRAALDRWHAEHRQEQSRWAAPPARLRSAT